MRAKVASTKVWKLIEKAGIVVGILAGLTIIYDFTTKKIGFVIPVIMFIWRVLSFRLSVLIIMFFASLVLLVSGVIRRRLGQGEIFVLGFIDEGERGLELIFRAYKKNFSHVSRIVSKCAAVMNKLENNRLVRMEALTGGMNAVQDELFKLTKKGMKKYKKLSPAIKTKTEQIFTELREEIDRQKVDAKSSEMEEASAQVAKESRIEPHEEVIHILYLLANQPGGAMKLRELEFYYMNKFKPREHVDLQLVLNKLELSHLIEEIGIGAMDELGYEIHRKGLSYFEKYRNSG